jgi:hypothetical protein
VAISYKRYNRLWGARKSQRAIKIAGISLFAAFVSSMFAFHLVFAADINNPPHCGLFELRLDCDLSGWMKLFIGDIGIGAFLALLLHTFSHRNQLKIEAIIRSEEEMRKRRHNYYIGHLRNLLNLVLYTLSVLKRSINQYNSAVYEKDSSKQLWIQTTVLSKLRADEAKLGRLLQSTRSLMVAANDVLEPELVNRVEGVCNFIGEVSVEENPNTTMEFPKYHVCRIKVQYLLELLNYQVPPVQQKQIVNDRLERPREESSSVVVEKVGE